MHTRIVVDFLEEVHFDEDIRIYGEVGPIDIPISSIVALLDPPFQRLCDLCHHWILSHYGKKDDT